MISYTLYMPISDLFSFGFFNLLATGIFVSCWNPRAAIWANFVINMAPEDLLMDAIYGLWGPHPKRCWDFGIFWIPRIYANSWKFRGFSEFLAFLGSSPSRLDWWMSSVSRLATRVPHSKDYLVAAQGLEGFQELLASPSGEGPIRPLMMILHTLLFLISF